MKLIILFLVLFSLSCCGTVGGAVRGLGSDLDILFSDYALLGSNAT